MERPSTPGLVCALAAVLALGLAPSPPVRGLALEIREAMRSELMNEADYERIERGYYERLIEADRRLDDAAGPATAEGRPGGGAVVAPFDAGPLGEPVDDLREYVLRPNLAADLRGATWTTNARGMRDRDYEAEKPPHCVRLALVGDSIAAGWGVADGRGFEPLLEGALDARSRAAGGPRVEVLNFAVPGLAPGQRWEHFTRVGWASGPDLVLCEATTADPGWDERRLRGLLPRGIGWDAPQYREALARAGARPGGDFETYRRTLRRSRWDLLAGVYRTIVADCRARGVQAVWVLIPRVGRPAEPSERARMAELARRSGFSAVLDLSDAFDGREPSALAIGPSDYHPNAEGHALLARRLEAALVGRPEVRRLWEGGDRHD